MGNVGCYTESLVRGRCPGPLGSRAMATLHLMVGLPCAGKTTLAKKLERELPALRLNIDECHIHLHGQDADDPEHDARHVRIEGVLWNIAARALELGVNVVLDYGLWAREERENYRARARELGAASEVHFLDVPEDELFLRLRKRNSRSLKDSFLISEEAMKPWIRIFRKPTPDELVRRE